jgi:hypothetical protein
MTSVKTKWLQVMQEKSWHDVIKHKRKIKKKRVTSYLLLLGRKTKKICSKEWSASIEWADFMNTCHSKF